ncbi:ArsR/SmtB family transcription factor [Algicella marina]|uniref:Metalloregulator ArsR/SmtB family transcription factor n=1 Tax=Algicella marina TaxID=2683284 RepID=A0A6P1T5K8_9RHOB|nr:metalloregulator ArsR/SmtB family transcription factor [Algicella marina]QHQ36579.1 metalloregulator ArsR/SmtB family transcription factor [Algicella marina]
MAKYDSLLDLHFTALGDPTRRAILTRLARGEATVSELAAPHDMALPSFLGHLKKLEDAGLITSRKQGRIRTCTLSPDAFLPVQDWLSEQREIWNGRLDRLDTYVTRLMKEKQNGTRPED